jgi:hypothetical protein
LAHGEREKLLVKSPLREDPRRRCDGWLRSLGAGSATASAAGPPAARLP